jgi:hypothetical protein
MSDYMHWSTDTASNIEIAHAGHEVHLGGEVMFVTDNLQVRMVSEVIPILVLDGSGSQTD